jgi:hypothetical protein
VGRATDGRAECGPVGRVPRLRVQLVRLRVGAMLNTRPLDPVLINVNTCWQPICSTDGPATPTAPAHRVQVHSTNVLCQLAYAMAPIGVSNVDVA